MLLVLSITPRTAKADLLGDFFESMFMGLVLVAVGGALVVTDIVFTAHDGAVVADDEQPTTGWAVGEALVTGPQALLIDGGMIAAAVQDDDDFDIGAVIYAPAIWLNTLAVHGSWSWASLDAGPDPDALYGVSWIIGANIPATMYMTARTITGRPASVPMSIALMAGTVPGTAVSAYHLATGESAKPGWGALLGWSGSMFLYGTTSLIINAADTGDAAEQDEYSDNERGAAPEVPPFALMPTTIPDIRNHQAFGVMAMGAF